MNQNEFENHFVNKIHCADCLDLMTDWPDERIDLTVTSPPYDDLRNYNGYKFDFEEIADQLFRVTKSSGVVVWVVGDATINGSETGTSFKQVLRFKKIGFNLHDTMIYSKRGFANPSSTRYHQIFEYMFVLSKGTLITFNPIKDRLNIEKRRDGITKRQKNGSMKAGKEGDTTLETYGQRFNIWSYKVGGGLISTDRIAHEHPAVFPEQLAADHIRSWSNPDDIVLDPFCGSGTTCVAAKKLGRHYIGIDISEKYCEIARQRLEAVDTGVPVKEQRAGQGALWK